MRAMKRPFASFAAGVVLGCVLTAGVLVSGAVTASSIDLAPQATGKSVAKVVLDNARVRVRDVTFPPGETAMHTHELPHVGVIIQGGTLVFRVPGRQVRDC